MPKEIIRKRGKRKAKTTEATVEEATEEAYQAQVQGSTSTSTHDLNAQPHQGGGGDDQERGDADWITPGDGGYGSIRERVEGDAPWGFVDAEVKAYFKTVDDRLKIFEEGGLPQGEEADEENEDRQLLVSAALSELRDKELQLSTDSDCALVIERMIWNMGDWGRRVFADSLSGNYEKLIQHRFGSHVVQTLFTLGALTVDRETRGIFPSQQATMDPAEGVLPFMSDLILSITKELLPTLPLLLQSPFSSHPIRVLLLLLSARPIPSPNDSNSNRPSALRSKRSTKYAKSHGTTKSVVQNEGEDGKTETRAVPAQFGEVLKEFWRSVKEKVGEQEIRALGVGQVAGPAIQMLIELEAAGGEAEIPGSLLDSILSGLVTALLDPTSPPPTRTDYLELLLRDPTGSHLFELLLRISPPRIFDLLWKTYFVGRIGKLAVHPVANFVMAKVVRRLGEEGLGEVLVEAGGGDWARGVKRARMGVLKEVVERATELKVHGEAVVDAIYQAFELKTPEDKNRLVPCALTLKTLKRYRKAIGEAPPEGEEPDADDDDVEETLDEKDQHSQERLEGEAEMTESEMYQKRRMMGRQRVADPLTPNMQGALLLQSILRMPSPHNEIVLNSLISLPVSELLTMTHHPISSRLFDAVIESPTVAFKNSRKIIMAFNGKWFEMVDDKVGSRVGEKLWDGCDGFLKEKIAKSLIPSESSIAGSQYGRFFGRRVNINLYRRRPDEWRVFQTPPPRPAPVVAPIAPLGQPIASTSTSTDSPATAVVEEVPGKKRKRDKTVPKVDEIDELFASAKAGLPLPTPAAAVPAPTPAPAPAPLVIVAPVEVAEVPSEEGKVVKKRKKSKVVEEADAGLGSILGAIKASVGGSGEVKKEKRKKEKKDKKEKVVESSA